MSDKKFSTVDDYIHTFPEETQAVLQKVRQTIRTVVPDGEEKISYGLPTVMLHGKYLIYFSGWKHHVSIYPVPAGDAAFQKEIEQYRSGKGTLKFPLDRPIPYDMVEQTAAFLLREHRAIDR